MFKWIKKIFIRLLTGLVNTCNQTKCFPVVNQKYMTQPILINLHHNEYSQEFYYYPFLMKLDRCIGRCNALNDLSNKVYVPNKIEELNLSLFNVAAGINKLKALIKHILCKCKCRFDGRKCNSSQCWNKDKCWCECKNRHVCEKEYVWNPSTCNCENGKYLASIMDDSAIICDEVI